jgi:hypothetical protein
MQAACLEMPSGALLAQALLAARAGIGTSLDQDRQFEIGTTGKIERYLLVGKQAIGRMLEGALAAFTSEHPLGIPEPSELRASATQFLDEEAKRGVMKMRAASRTKLRGDAAGALLPRTDERARGGLKEDEVKQVARPRLVQPADEQAFGLRVPAVSIPVAVEDVGRRNDRLDAIKHG